MIANNTLGGKPTFAAVCIEVYNADFPDLRDFDVSGWFRWFHAIRFGG